MASKDTFIGLDCSDGEIHAALYNGQFAAVPLGNSALEPLFFCDKAMADNSIGVSFPSILRSLGSQRAVALGGTAESRLEDVFRDRLAEIHKILSARHPVKPVTLAVPTGLTGMRRRILLDCAREAGFTDVELMDRSLAAAIGYRGEEEDAQTLLVVASCYGGTDLSLVRLGKGRARVLASQSLEVLGEQHLAEASLEALILRLRQENIFLGLKQLTPLQWLQFHALAGNLWRDLVTGKPAHCAIPKALTSLSVDHHTDIDPAPFAASLAQAVERLLDGIRGLFETAELEPADVDLILLSGTTAGIPLVAEPIARLLGKKPVTGPPNLVAFGAAFQASQQKNLPVPPAPVSPSGPSRPPQLRPEPAAAPPAAPVAPDPLSISNLRRLIEQRQFETARTIFTQMVAALNDVKDEFNAAYPASAPASAAPQPSSASASPGSPRRWISDAFNLVSAGRHVEAVALAHQAYAADNNDPDIFAGMMRVHIEAALALSRPEDYQPAIRLLECAKGHDPSDNRVLIALGQRHLMHAREMRRLNNYSAARECVTNALRYDPKNPDAISLHAELIQAAQAE